MPIRSSHSRALNRREVEGHCTVGYGVVDSSKYSHAAADADLIWAARGEAGRADEAGQSGGHLHSADHNSTTTTTTPFTASPLPIQSP